ncbi:BRCT domain-containing protein [Rhynchospora pubera]|uniref:BRCT domain-containing protein n=1 Tax=Rhynchospora pubera TaxID=906938 RepID=A0AAV8FR90_9POAL|nr:BRCT domain-containing protein [Rhynchospora pubera]
MVRSRGELSPNSVFSGVRFVLLGFDSVSEEQYRSEIIQKGGVDLGKYDPTCTHVIVCGRVYDDPMCVMARDNGKIVVTEAWVDDSLDLGVLADETKVLYRPVRDLEGIPGSKSLHICLTGYQRQGREDIMRMVAMMGARFSKPLIANQITHLVCYKFEGEKYELAKRVNIKLVNHCWLEDCLKAWALLPIDNYTKSGWDLEMMEAEARDSEEETDDVMTKGKSLDQTVNRQTASLYNRPSSSATHNPLVRSPAPRQLDNPESSGLNQVHSTTQSKDADSEMMVNLPIKSPPRCELPTSEGPFLGKSCSVMPLKSSDPSRLNKKADARKPEVNLPVKAPLQGASVTLSSIALDPRPKSPAPRPSNNQSARDPPETSATLSSIALDPPLKSPAPRRSNNQGARDPPETMPHEDSGLKNVILNTKSPDRPLAPNSSKDPENLDNMEEINIRSEKMDSLPINRSHLVNVTHTINASTRQSQGADISGEKQNLVRTPVEEIKSGGIANFKVKSPQVTEAREQIMVKGSCHEISSEKGKSLTKVGESKIEGTSCMDPQNEGRHENGYSWETPHSTKSAAPSLSENKVISSSELISSTNVVITGNSTTTPQSGIGYRKGLSVPSASPLETTKCQTLSSRSKHGLCEARSAVLSDSTAPKKSYTRKLRKKSASPVEGQSDPSVNSTTPKVTSAILPEAVEGRTGEACMDVDIEKSMEQSGATIPHKRKASDRLIHNSSSVGDEFDELEHINSLCKKRDAVSNDQVVERRTSNGSGTTNPVCNNSRTKRTSLKCARSPRCSPSNKVGLTEAAQVRTEAVEVRTEANMEEVTTKQSNVLDFSSYFGSQTDNRGNTTSTILARDGDIERRDALKQSGKVEVENKIVEIKGLSPDSMEAEVNKHLSGVSTDLCNKHKHSAGGRTKKAVAKRSVKRNVQYPDKNVYREAGSNSGEKLDASNNILNNGTINKGKESDVGPEDADCGTSKEVKSNLSVNGDTANQIAEHGIRDEADAPDERPKGVKTNVPRKMEITCGVSMESNKKISIQKDVARAKTTIGSKSKSNKSNVTSDWLSTSTELDPEKENKPGSAEPSTAHSKPNLECNSKPVSTERAHAGINSVTCFILSGHRFQRKEFQAVIKKLRGRVCRDSHNWSFQATHFIVPGPVRRTEKFFAAAASGRWILKMEYLTACNEAGRFIEEEPYEWYGSGMTEDSSISLEAPRKWRLVREKTGHGAFYGMRIFIYGECIVPSLDTLKRVIKAGDGTILATSPPYTRILKSNCVHFAVIPATTPSNDPWVREFLNHQIPCVTSDYLVEYVCKPGYSLSKHVLFQTQEWADKSLEKLTELCQEVVCEFNSPSKLRDGREGQDDLRCAVCASLDRAEVMLICGDESGSLGCGIGTHIDCCNPPLQAVPNDDWFCCKCSKLSSKKTTLAKKGNKRYKKG